MSVSKIRPHAMKRRKQKYRRPDGALLSCAHLMYGQTAPHEETELMAGFLQTLLSPLSSSGETYNKKTILEAIVDACEFAFTFPEPYYGGYNYSRGLPREVLQAIAIQTAPEPCRALVANPGFQNAYPMACSYFEDFRDFDQTLPNPPRPFEGLRDAVKLLVELNAVTQIKALTSGKCTADVNARAVHTVCRYKDLLCETGSDLGSYFEDALEILSKPQWVKDPVTAKQRPLHPIFCYKAFSTPHEGGAEIIPFGRKNVEKRPFLPKNRI